MQPRVVDWDMVKKGEDGVHLGSVCTPFLNHFEVFFLLPDGL